MKEDNDSESRRDDLEENWSILSTELSTETLGSLQQHFEESLPQRTTGAEDALGTTYSTFAVGDELHSTNKAYKLKEYWDGRFESEEHYDWLANYVDMSSYIRDSIPRNARVLIVGCGNSSLSADMFDDGYSNVLSTDFSEIVVAKMASRNKTRSPGLRWAQMDMLALDLADSSIDAVVDKAAMDALMVDKGDPWNPNPAVVEQTHRVCTEIARVLVPNGVYIQLSFEQPHFRRKFLLGEHARASHVSGCTAGCSNCPVVSHHSKTCRNDEASMGKYCGLSEGPKNASSCTHLGGKHCYRSSFNADAADHANDGGETEKDRRNDGSHCNHQKEYPRESGETYGWDLQVHDIQREGGCFGYFLYVMHKGNG